MHRNFNYRDLERNIYKLAPIYQKDYVIETILDLIEEAYNPKPGIGINYVTCEKGLQLNIPARENKTICENCINKK